MTGTTTFCWIAGLRETPRFVAHGDGFLQHVLAGEDGSLASWSPAAAAMLLAALLATILLWIVSSRRTRTMVTAAEQRFRALVETSSDWIWETDATGVYTYCSPQVEKILGYAPRALIGHTAFEFMSSEEAGRVSQIFHDCAASARPLVGIENTLLTKDGREVQLETSGVPFLSPSGEVLGYRGINRDITARKQALGEARQLFENSMVGIFRTDFTGNILVANPAVLHLMRYESLEAMNAVGLRNLYVQPDDRDRLMEMVKEGPVEAFETTVIRGDGALIDVLLTIYPIRTDAGALRFLEGNLIDITEHKQTRAREAALRQRLSNAERMESLGLLTGGIAHDLNNVLGPLVALPQILEADIREVVHKESSTTEAIWESLEIIKASAARASAVVRDLVALGRRGEYDLLPVDVNRLDCASIEGEYVAELARSHPNVTFERVPASTRLLVSGSEGHLTRAIYNVVRNAAESIEGPGIVTVRTYATKLDATYRGYEEIPAGRYAVLEVSDTGCGIPDEHINRIFEPFFSLKKRSDRRGSGLGLAVVHGIIKDHGGYVEVRSRSEGGTQFLIYLPLLGDHASDHEDQASPPPGGTEQILVVDDEPAQRYLMRTVLTRLGYRIAEVASGSEAEAYLADKGASDIDLAIVDMIMSDDMDGLDTLSAIRARIPALPVLLASGHAEDERSQEALERGACWLSKPYSPEELARAVRKCLDTCGAQT